jgi:hypothetical protein
MEDKLAFVQFLHPGAEHSSGNWNTGTHGRRFVKVYGSYLESEQIHQDDLTFWCEWEPEAKLIKTFDNPARHEPKYLWKPYYCSPNRKSQLQNTDPFVFGEQFYYVCCQQWKKENPTQLKFLERGSIILFGSHLGRCFVLDTVFVVANSVDITSRNHLRQSVPQTYKDVTLSWIFPDNGSSSCAPNKEIEPCVASEFRLYIGANYNNPVAGMFSYFPCLPYKEEDFGFKRPHIVIDGVITQYLTQSYKYNHQPPRPISIADNYQLWQQVKNQVEDRGLKLGVYAQLPAKKDS